jgi:predicted RNase H-like HicB family nuclease
MQVVTLIHEEDGVYGASFPDFPGCTTVADDPDTILAKAAEALAFHIAGMVEDGLPLPHVRALSELRRDPEFRDAAADALIALVPYDFATRAVRVNITLDQSLLTRIDRASEAAGKTRSGFLADAARRQLALEAERAETAVLVRPGRS